MGVAPELLFFDEVDVDFRIGAKPLDLPFFGMMGDSFDAGNKGDFGSDYVSIGLVKVEMWTTP